MQVQLSSLGVKLWFPGEGEAKDWRKERERSTKELEDFLKDLLLTETLKRIDKKEKIAKWKSSYIKEEKCAKKELEGGEAVCKMCGLEFRSRRHLEDHLGRGGHLRVARGEVQGRWEHRCNLCGINFTRQEGLNLHIARYHQWTESDEMTQPMT